MLNRIITILGAAVLAGTLSAQASAASGDTVAAIQKRGEFNRQRRNDANVRVRVVRSIGHGQASVSLISREPAKCRGMV